MLDDEFRIKMDRIRGLLEVHELDALLLKKASSFAWATCGAASFINTASTYGEASLLITKGDQYLITNNIEAPRLEEEERLASLGWKIMAEPWYEPGKAIDRLAKGLYLGSDNGFPGSTDLSGEVARLRSHLLPDEGERFRLLGRLTAETMKTAIDSIRPGMTEMEIAGHLAGEAERLGAQPIVILVATDERTNRFRHPLPTKKVMEQYAMLVLCTRASGLVCSITRLIHFGSLSMELRHKMESVAHVDAALIHATTAGRPVKEVFRTGQQAYALAGYSEEWRLHHQGGVAGYEPREFIATPDSEETVKLGQAFAWNPSITGTKSEDTILVEEAGFQVLTEIPDWPMIDVFLSAANRPIARPAILEVV